MRSRGDRVKSRISKKIFQKAKSLVGLLEKFHYLEIIDQSNERRAFLFIESRKITFVASYNDYWIEQIQALFIREEIYLLCISLIRKFILYFNVYD